jgi:predicted flap endonuclease-1-like 5' DNA nuclease
MNFWTGLILGLIVGWLIEWAIDWLFWRRQRSTEEAGIRSEIHAARLEANKLRNELNIAERQGGDWRTKYNELVQECQERVIALESANAELRARLEPVDAGLTTQLDMAPEVASTADAGADTGVVTGVVTGVATGVATGVDVAMDTGVVSEANAEEISIGTRMAGPADIPYTQEQPADDLQIIEGIGPKYDILLREHGITTFGQLAASDEATLAGIINAPAWRKISFGEWITQAKLAAAGDEAGLRELQNRLGRRS